MTNENAVHSLERGARWIGGPRLTTFIEPRPGHCAPVCPAGSGALGTPPGAARRQLTGGASNA